MQDFSEWIASIYYENFRGDAKKPVSNAINETSNCKIKVT